MACFTMVTVDVPDTDLNRKARKALGLPLEGRLTRAEAARVRVEAGVIKARDEIRKIHPSALIVRKGDVLTVSVSV